MPRPTRTAPAARMDIPPGPQRDCRMDLRAARTVVRVAARASGFPTAGRAVAPAAVLDPRVAVLDRREAALGRREAVAMDRQVAAWDLPAVLGLPTTAVWERRQELWARTSTATGPPLAVPDPLSVWAFR